ncbi:MAG: PKD domain-containing protein [Euryarchaeota archaeon]|nr:PKD domain-containing protein [Euryarchaeota archaeon]
MKKIIPICIIGILLCAEFGATALSSTDPKIISENNVGKAEYTHTVFVEVGTATWCSDCPASNTAWHSIYEGGNYNFEYTEMVVDKNTVANARRNQYNQYSFPTSYFDGGQFVYPGTSISAFQNNLNSCGSREVPDLVANLNATWLGSAKIQVDFGIINNDAVSYAGNLRVYIIELQSTQWRDYNGSWYNHAFLDFAFNQTINISVGETYSDSTVWDGATHGYPGISSENIQVILAVFDDSPHQGYSHPPSGSPFWAYYVDETIAATPQSNNTPKKPNPPSGPTSGIANVEYSYSGNTTDPNGDNIYYLFNWGDGSNSGWLGPYPSGTTVEASHVWSYGGIYNVKLKAKDTIDGPWSDPLVVQIAGPDIELQNVKGGFFKVSAEIKNTGDVAVSNVNWNITLRSGVFIGKQTSGLNLTIPANSSVTIKSGLIFGLGSTSIKVEAWIPDGPSTMIQRNGDIFLFLIKVNP